MRRRFALLAVFALTARASFLAPPVRAQISNLPHRCTILAEASESEKPLYPPIVIHDVEFDGKISLPESDLEQFVSNLKQVKFYASPHWTDEIGEVERDHWSDQGYFQVELRAEAQTFSLDSAGEHVFLTIRVDEGPKFWLKEIRFRKDDIVEPDSDASASEGRPTLRRKTPLSDESRPGTNAVSALAFPSDQLRELVPLQDGDVFSTAKIRQGLDALKKLYSSRGYIEFVATPNVESDEQHRVVLKMEIDEGKQFRIDKVTTVGGDHALEQAIQTALPRGELFANDVFEAAVKSVIPDFPFERAELYKNEKHATVDVTVDLRPCPLPEH